MRRGRTCVPLLCLRGWTGLWSGDPNGPRRALIKAIADGESSALAAELKTKWPPTFDMERSTDAVTEGGADCRSSINATLSGGPRSSTVVGGPYSTDIGLR
jgi:hypothetical protein